LQQHELNDIIEACKKNNSVAQEKLYKHFFALMFTICKKYTEDRQTIVSLINEGFLKIFHGLKNFDPHKGNFEGWAKKIMTNTCIDFYRAQKSKSSLLNVEEDSLNENVLKQLPASYAEEEVLHLIKRLPAVTQKVFSLHVFKGYSHKEIAEIMDMAESTSRWHVSEARKNLKTQVHKIW
jgi:RNA polymerase sigma-70 factor (ECF subfamily)